MKIFILTLFCISLFLAGILIILLIKKRANKIRKISTIYVQQKKPNYLSKKLVFVFLTPLILAGLSLYVFSKENESKKANTNPKALNNNKKISFGNLIEDEKIVTKSLFAKETISDYNLYLELDTAIELLTKKNENITKILKPYGVSETQIWELDNYLKRHDLFNLKKNIRPGKKYTLFLKNTDSIPELKYFTYEINQEKYLFVEMSDSIFAKIHTRETIIKTKKISGVINSSLWFALEDAGLSTDLEIDAVLDEITEKIYPWTINFYKIYPEDRFKIIYDAKYINNHFFGIEKVHASLFSHNGKDNYAIAFSEGSEEEYEYYDPDGNNLRKFFLTAPVSYKRISSRYSKARKHPVTGKVKSHKGTDFAASPGSPIYATADGTIETVGYTKYNGYYVKIKHNNTYSTQYLHMNKKSQNFWKKNNIKTGKKVKQKDIIGYVGSTGLATGPHVCYRFWKNGEQVDPFKCSLPPSKPIEEKKINEFNSQKSKWILQLDSILYQDGVEQQGPIEVSNRHYP